MCWGWAMCAAWRRRWRSATRLDPEGTLWSRNADACCDFRKTVPLGRALEPFEAQITGRKRFQTRERANMQPVEYFEGRFRFNPLWQWDLHQLEAYTGAPQAAAAIRWWKTAIPRSAACPAPAASRPARIIAPAAGRASTRMSAASTSPTAAASDVSFGPVAAMLTPGDCRFLLLRAPQNHPSDTCICRDLSWAGQIAKPPAYRNFS